MSRTSHIEQLAVYVLTFVLLAVVPGMPAAAQQTPASTAGADTTLQDDAPPPAPSIPAPATAPDPEEPPIRLLATGWLIFGLRVVLVCLLSSFMAITARSFLRTRLRKKEYEYTRLLALLGVDADDQRLYSASIHDEYDASDYVLPVAFATLASLVGFVWIVFGNEIANAPTGQSVLLTGPGSVVVAQKDTFPEMARAFRHRSVMVLGFSFLGAFLWSAQNITRRLVTVDLQPSAYYSAALRIFLANFTALVLAWLLGDQGKLTEGLLPAVAFLTGMLPEQAILWVREKSRIFSRKKERKADDLELEMIEGINLFHKVRLGEVGIDNAQNLAEANLIALILRTPFPPRALIDWIAQANLYTACKEDVEALRRVGVRTILDLQKAVRIEGALHRIAEEAGISELKLELVAGRITDDPEVERLERLRSLLGVIGSDSDRSPR